MSGLEGVNKSRKKEEAGMEEGFHGYRGGEFSPLHRYRCTCLQMLIIIIIICLWLGLHFVPFGS